jgi:hypothetical protein
MITAVKVLSRPLTPAMTTIDDLITVSDSVKTKLAHMILIWMGNCDEGDIFNDVVDRGRDEPLADFKVRFNKKARQLYIKDKQVLGCACDEATWDEFFKKMIDHPV